MWLWNTLLWLLLKELMFSSETCSASWWCQPLGYISVTVLLLPQGVWKVHMNALSLPAGRCWRFQSALHACRLLRRDSEVAKAGRGICCSHSLGAGVPDPSRGWGGKLHVRALAAKTSRVLVTAKPSWEGREWGHSCADPACCAPLRPTNPSVLLSQGFLKQYVVRGWISGEWPPL